MSRVGAARKLHHKVIAGPTSHETRTGETLAMEEYANTTSSPQNLQTQAANYSVSTSAPVIDKPDFKYIGKAYFYLMAIVLPAGIVCNVLALLVFIFTRKLRRTVTGHYLLALAVADLLFLIGDFVRWLNTTTLHVDTGVDFMHTGSAVCKITYFIRYSGKLTSAWITVAITAQRFFTVVTPLKVAVISTSFRIKVIIVSIYVLSHGVSVFPFWTLDSFLYKNEYICGILSGKNYEIWKNVVLNGASLLVPGILIMILTIVIVCDLVRASRKRARSLALPRQSSVTSTALMETHLSLMLVAVAIAFLCTRTPYAIIFYINHYKKTIWDPIDPWLSYRIYCAYKLTDVFASLNYAGNFFLYCLCGSTFREHFCNFLCCRRAPSNQDTFRKRMTTITHTSSARKHELMPLSASVRSNSAFKPPVTCKDKTLDTELTDNVNNSVSSGILLSHKPPTSEVPLAESK